MLHDIALGMVICLLFISLIIAFCAIVIKLYIKKIKNYTQQLYQKDLDFQKTLTTAVIETQEQVLNDISQDLHDDAGQQLTYINFQLENLKLDSPGLNDKLDPLSQSLGNLSKSIRGISHALNNQLLLQQDLIKAIATEVKRLQRNDKIAITYSYEEVAPKHFSANEKIIIYRIFQECINNSFKHAKARKISVSLTTKPHFEMVIADDGKGFDVDSKKNKTSLGLLNMNNRAKSIDYSFTIKAQAGEGATITLSENKTV